MGSKRRKEGDCDINIVMSVEEDVLALEARVSAVVSVMLKKRTLKRDCL